MFSSKTNRILACLLCLLPGLQAPAHAEEVSERRFTLSGFGTLGAARSSSRHVDFVRDLSQPVGIKSGRWSGRIDSMLGVQANWQLGADWEVVGQAVSRLHYDSSHDPEVMWAFAKWEPDPRFNLRFGRIGADFMMLADSRLVGYSYLPVRPSADFFGPLFFSHFDGVDGSLTLPLAGGVARGKLFYGKTQEKTAGAPGIWDSSGSPVRGLVLDYQTGPWQLHANAAEIRFASNVGNFGLHDQLRAAGTLLGSPETLRAADGIRTKHKASRFMALGVAYDEGPVQIQAMVNRTRHQTDVFADSHAAYVLAAYRLGNVTPYVGVSRWKSKRNARSAGLPPVPPFSELEQGYRQYMAASQVDQKTYSVGVRWDFYRNLALKAQWDAVRGEPDSRFAFARSDAAWNGKTDVLSVTLDFVF